MTKQIKCIVNGNAVEVYVDVRESLADMLEIGCILQALKVIRGKNVALALYL